MDLDQFESMKAYVAFDVDSERRLKEVHELAAPHFHAITDDFYDAILRHPRAASVLTEGPRQVERLSRTLLDWLHSVLLGPFDAAWLERHSRIGRVHVRIGLPQEFMLTAMNRIRSALLDLIERAQASPEVRAARTRAVNQILDLELAVMLDTYRDDLVQRMRVAERTEVAETVPAFVLALDEKGAIQHWNQHLEMVTGWSRESMLGKDGRDLVGTGGDRRLPLASGGHRLVRWNCSAAQGGLTYAVGVDVTDEREMQRRTLRAERLAAVGTLAAGLAHEVRNPLNSALLQLQVLRRRVEKRAEPAEILEVSTLVSQEIHRLGGLVSDFLAFAQPRPLALEVVRVADALSAIERLVRPEALQAGVELVLEVDPAAGCIDAERERLTQVLLNLTRNAIQAMEGGGRLTLRARRPDAQGNLQLEVEDTGPGFPEDAPIFDAFYTTKPTGTGLGLAIVHRIVTDHGGSVHAHSRPGCTRFVLSFPARAAAPEPEPPRSSS